MKKFTFLVALLCASVFTYADPELVYDTNFALQSNGSSATASTGNAALAIDGDEGTRWESAKSDDETWTLDMGQLRVFNTIKILWEGAYAKEFELTSSNDGEAWTNLYTETNLTQAGWQEIKLAENKSARYIKYHGTKRATEWGQSFYEFQVVLPGVSKLTTIELSAPKIAKVGEGVDLTVVAKDQNNSKMDVTIEYEITPATAGAITNGKYVPAKVGNATIVAKSGDVKSAEISIFGYEGDNLAWSTNIDNDNKVIAQSDFAPSGTNAFFAVDGNNGSVYQGSATNGTAGDDASRTYDVWFVVDLGDFYDIDLITINFEGACSQDYHVDFSADNATWVVGYNHVGAAGINGRTDMLSAAVLDNYQKVRYVRFWSTKAGTEWGVKIFEFQVFGRAWVPASDSEAPVMVSATLDSKTWNSVVLAVEATDNQGISKFHVVDAANAIDAKYAANEGKITITGLTAATAYNFTVTAIDVAQNESANSKAVAVTTEEHHIVPTTAAPVPAWPAAQVKSLYSDAYDFAPASLNSYNEGWWDNPTLTEEAVGEDHFLHYNLYRNGMIGVQFAETSVATMEKIHIDVYASAAGTITFRPITAGDAEAINNTKQTLTLEAEKWNSFDFDLADFGEHNWTRLFQYSIEGYQAGGLVGEHICIDNVYFYRTTALVDNEKPTDVTAAKVSEDIFSVVLAVSAKDNSGAFAFDVMAGDKVLATSGGASGATVNVNVPGLLPNTEYNLSVIVKDEADNKAEAVTVHVKTMAAPAPAPKPDFTGKLAVAVFCDALAGGPAINIGGWGQTTVTTFGQLAEGDNVCYGTNFNYLGWELTPAVNAEDMEFLHADFYTADMQNISVTPISPGHEGIYVANLTAGNWTSVDVPLTAFDGKQIDWSNIFQMKFFDATPAGKAVFIDNVYFYKNDQTDMLNVTTGAVVATKVIRDGQLLIIRDGVAYTMQGVRVR
ncbi:MAG: discoidin domain-containing protein [Paludibacteraceae bacterium]|nr:discoidin domain-containing protein [Paludibacteraceae bacterium]